MSTFRRLAVALMATAALIAIPPPASADLPAAATTDVAVTSVQTTKSWVVVTAATDRAGAMATFRCPLPYLANPTYGPLCRGTQVDGDRGRPCNFSPITGRLACGGWLPVHEVRFYEFNTGYGTVTRGWASLVTGYGPAVVSTQYQVYDTHGRWGWYNLITGAFYPDGDGRWYKTSS